VLEGLQGPLNDEQKESLHTAKDCCDQMVFMMNDILDAARIETGKLSLQCERGSIADVLAKAVRNCQSPAMRRGVTLDSSVAEDTEHAYFDAQRLR
jgi:hypothetical protein